jgi:Tat protein secretion system quality control protein TatD with DNase activity
LPQVLAAIARLRGEAEEDIARATTANARRLFAIPETTTGPEVRPR